MNKLTIMASHGNNGSNRIPEVKGFGKHSNVDICASNCGGADKSNGSLDPEPPTIPKRRYDFQKTYHYTLSLTD